MKLLIILPVFLLAALLVWIAVDGQRGGIRETPASGQETAAAPAAQEGEQTAASAPGGGYGGSVKAGVSETGGKYGRSGGDRTGGSCRSSAFSGDVYFSSHVLTAYDNAGAYMECWMRHIGTKSAGRTSIWRIRSSRSATEERRLRINSLHFGYRRSGFP